MHTQTNTQAVAKQVLPSMLQMRNPLPLVPQVQHMQTSDLYFSLAAPERIQAHVRLLLYQFLAKQKLNAVSLPSLQGVHDVVYNSHLPTSPPIWAQLGLRLDTCMRIPRSERRFCRMCAPNPEITTLHPFGRICRLVQMKDIVHCQSACAASSHQPTFE